jgi:hypothetical protein
MTSVTDPEISAFLSAGTRTGVLGFASADGRPLVTPVWFIGKRNAVPGELVVRLRPTKVIAALNVTA